MFAESNNSNQLNRQ